MREVRASMECPRCHGRAHVLLNVLPLADEDSRLKAAVESYSCPRLDYVDDEVVLRTLGYAEA